MVFELRPPAERFVMQGHLLGVGERTGELFYFLFQLEHEEPANAGAVGDQRGLPAIRTRRETDLP